MIEIRRKKGLLSIRELYFSKSCGVAADGEDLQYLVQTSKPGNGNMLFYSSILDLAQDDARLLAGVRKNYSYEIRRAKERDQIVPVVWTSPDVAQIDAFSNFFDEFAASKLLGTANRGKLRHLAESGGLVVAFSIVTGKPDRWYSAHAYICDGKRARLLYSAGNVGLTDSEERKVLGRANKLLHWNMIEYFKNQGFGEYDLGGISKSAALQAVDDFKLGFGGREVLEYNYLIGVTALGKLAVFALTLATKLKRLRSKAVQA